MTSFLAQTTPLYGEHTHSYSHTHTHTYTYRKHSIDRTWIILVVKRVSKNKLDGFFYEITVDLSSTTNPKPKGQPSHCLFSSGKPKCLIITLVLAARTPYMYIHACRTLFNNIFKLSLWRFHYA